MLMERLRGRIGEIDRGSEEQNLAFRDLAVSRLRHQLDRMRTEQMLPLARLGLRLFAGDAEMESALRVPHKRAPTDAILIAAARMAKAPEPHRAQLKSAKTDPERINRLKSDTRLLKTQFRDAYAGMADRAVPTRHLADLMKSARLERRAVSQ